MTTTQQKRTQDASEAYSLHKHFALRVQPLVPVALYSIFTYLQAALALVLTDTTY